MNKTVQKSLSDRLVERYVAVVWRHRPFVVLLLSVMTLFWLFQARHVEMYSQFADLLPQKHPYIQAYNHHRETFGGAANVLTLVLAVKEGDIFTTTTLKKVQYLTEQMDLLAGVDHNQIASICHVKIRNVKTLPGGLIRSYPVLPAEIPTSPQELATLKLEMFNNDIVYNQYISGDGKAALVLAGFNEERLDYREIHRELMRLKHDVEDGKTVLYIAGEPMLKGWVWYFTNELYVIFTVTALLMFVPLVFYFRRLYGVLVPFLGAIVQSIWGLGMVGLLGYNLDPLILVIPLLISSRAISHAVQMTERYFEDLEESGDNLHAAETAFKDLFLPGLIGVVADAGGILVLAVATIPLIHKLALYGSFWAFSNIFTILHLTPIVLSLLPKPELTGHYTPKIMVKLLRWIGEMATGPVSRWVLVAVGAVVIVTGVKMALAVPVGDQQIGSPLLWPDAHYNVSARNINQWFAGANQLVIYVEGTEENILKEPRVLAAMEDFRRYLLAQPEAGGTRELATLVKSLNRLWHYNDPTWQVLPPDRVTAANLLFVYEAGAPNSQAIFEYTDRLGQNGQFVVFYKDTKGDTIREAIARAHKFIAEHPVEGVRFRLAGGVVGTVAALNEEIAASEKQATLFIILTVYGLVWVSYGSFVAANMVMVALLAAGVASYMYIALAGVGMNINSLPVTAVGMGIGVDYILYVVDRIRREVPLAAGEIVPGIKRAVATTGMAVTFTATTMMAGVIPWYFLSSLRFSAEMAILLTILLLTHWLAALTLTPAMFAIFKPRFVQGEPDSGADIQLQPVEGEVPVVD
jgi:predicted RND superfamily exporter protein